MIFEIGKREAFSRNYSNAQSLGFGQDAVDHVEKNLKRLLPAISWDPDTGTLWAEGSSLKEVRNTYDADKLAELMERWWGQAFEVVLPDPPEFKRLLEMARFFGTAPTMRSVEQQFSIPYRTLQNWAEGRRPCPEYIRRLLMKAWGWY